MKELSGFRVGYVQGGEGLKLRIEGLGAGVEV